MVYTDRIVVTATDPSRGLVMVDGRCLPCALGRGGTIAAADKREGDGCTPLGSVALRHVMYRPDRWSDAPQTGLPVQALTPEDGWCDDPADPSYNRPVSLPFEPSHEKLWRDEGVYDLIVDLGFNDDPPVPGHGSAIFLHLARDGFQPTEGCIALGRDDLVWLLARCGPQTVMEIRATAP